MGMMQDFRDFAIKGNAVDLAVGVVIGAASGKAVDSVVKDLFNPPLGWLIGGVNFSDLKVVIQKGVEANALIFLFVAIIFMPNGIRWPRRRRLARQMLADGLSATDATET